MPTHRNARPLWCDLFCDWLGYLKTSTGNSNFRWNTRFKVKPETHLLWTCKRRLAAKTKQRSIWTASRTTVPPTFTRWEWLHSREPTAGMLAQRGSGLPLRKYEFVPVNSKRKYLTLFSLPEMKMRDKSGSCGTAGQRFLMRDSPAQRGTVGSPD